MIQVSLDTSFLISFADPTRKHHSVALDYFRYCLSQPIPMWISVVAAGEFEVGQPVSDLPLQNFRILPYNLAHAIRAASLFRAAKKSTSSQPGERKIIINDLKLLAQAAEDNIGIILTEDENTLSKMAARLRSSKDCAVEVVLLSDGFKPGTLRDPKQTEFGFKPEGKKET